MSSIARMAWVPVAILAAIVGGLAMRGAPSQPTPRAEAASLPPVGRVAQRVERLRGLRFRYVPKVQLVSADALTKKLSGSDAHPSAAQRRAARGGLAPPGGAPPAGGPRPPGGDPAPAGGGGGGGHRG